jgi:hypothetical protein
MRRLIGSGYTEELLNRYGEVLYELEDYPKRGICTQFVWLQWQLLNVYHSGTREWDLWGKHYR